MTYPRIPYIIIQSLAAMAQSVEHVLGKDEVTSSSLVSSSKISTLSEGAFSLSSSLPRTVCEGRGPRNIEKDILGRRSALGVTDGRNAEPPYPTDKSATRTRSPVSSLVSSSRISTLSKGAFSLSSSLPRTLAREGDPEISGKIFWGEGAL